MCGLKIDMEFLDRGVKGSVVGGHRPATRPMMADSNGTNTFKLSLTTVSHASRYPLDNAAVRYGLISFGGGTPAV